jgi:hypothetical protein
MGMDVMGKNPVSERGEYFRNNVWWWHPLWQYCEMLAPELCEDISGHTNDGAGLSDENAMKLAQILSDAIDSGHAAEYERERLEFLGTLERPTCQWCDGTGIRTDQVGIDAGMPEAELPTELAIILGRTHGTCNACRGEGLSDHPESWYQFNVDNVKEFVGFLQDCGGFQIW